MSVTTTMIATTPPDETIPSAAAWLGGLGLIPFVALSAASQLASGDPQATAAQALLGYGAVILSFLGGIHWGAAMTRTMAGAAPGAARLGISVVPSLAGWMALLLERRAGLALLVLAFAAMLLIDIRSVRQGLLPGWYRRLRKPLTTIVVAALLVALAGR